MSARLRSHPSSLGLLNKKAGGLRPIAIGYVWRRLAAKCANRSVLPKLVDYFRPIQLGVGIPGGCEAAVHASRIFLQQLPDNYVLAKLDFANAFNSVDRPRVLAEVSELAPEILNFCLLSYGSASKLKFGDFSVPSESGVQQGDPLGPLLFCLAIHPILASLRSDLIIGFLDDVTLGGLPIRWPQTFRDCPSQPATLASHSTSRSAKQFVLAPYLSLTRLAPSSVPPPISQLFWGPLSSADPLWTKL